LHDDDSEDDGDSNGEGNGDAGGLETIFGSSCYAPFYVPGVYKVT
jgi:hypothetical protein